MDARYSLLIQWSEEDRLYLVTIPEFAGRVAMPCTHGESYEVAARRGQEVIETFLEMWQEDGTVCPEPNLFVLRESAEALQVA